MNIKLYDSFDQLSLQDVLRLEKDLHVTLPAEYKAFLLQHNGGWFREYVRFPFLEESVYDQYGQYGLISHFYGITTEAPGSDIKEQLSWYNEQLPAEMIPIGGDSGGNNILLSTQGGQVYYWDHEEEAKPENLLLSGHSFLHFEQSLTLDPDHNRYRETSDIFRAAEKGDETFLKTFLLNGGDPDSRNDQHRTLLMVAANNGRSEIVKMLLSAGIDLNAKDDRDNEALYYAVVGHSVDSVKLLLANHADINAKDSNGVTILMHAIKVCANSIAKMLIDRGADINAKSLNRETAVSCCGKNPFVTKDILAKLKSRGAVE